MQWISSWVAGISAVALMASVISVIAPENSAGRVASMLGGVLVLVALVSPIFNFEASELLREGRRYEEQIAKRIAETEEKTEEIKNDIIRRKLEAYVLEKAKTDEGKCRISIEVSDGAAVSATVRCGEAPTAARVAEILSSELGIAEERVKIWK